MNDKELRDKIILAIHEIDEVKEDLKVHRAAMEKVVTTIEEKVTALEKRNNFVGGLIAGVSFLWIVITQAIPWIANLIQKKVGL